MARRSEIAAVYAAGAIQGVALVTFPAASSVFTNPGAYGLSSTEYGAMFVPQAVMAIAASLLGAGLRGRLGSKRIYLLGLLADLLAMGLLVASRFAKGDHARAYGVLLAATACLGIGFGFTVPALNTLAAALFPRQVDQAVLGMNALLGLGTALAPVLVALFVALGCWWGLPALVAALILGLIAFSAGQAWNEDGSAPAGAAPGGRGAIPGRFWAFAAFALLYGVCETMNGNWAALLLTRHFGASAAMGSLALALFWGMVTGGRILFAAIAKWVPEPWVCRILPLVLAAAFAAGACVPKTHAHLGLLGFALAGFGCSALLPLTISFAQKELRAIAASVAGGLIAFYQLGYGVAAFGVGPLVAHAGLNLSALYGGTAAVALAMGVLSLVVTRNAGKRA